MIIVDRVEGKFAVCESAGRMVDIPIKLIKGKIRDGVVLEEKEGIYYVDEEATQQKEDHIREESSGLWNK